MHNYKKLVKEMRKKSFPEIKGKIWIIKIPFSIPGGAVFWLFPRLNILALTTKCFELKKSVLIGLLAHELSHFSIFQRKKWICFYLFFIKYLFNHKYRIKEEKKADRLAIKKGYGKELIEVKIEAKKICKGTKYENFVHEKISNNYLSVKDVEKYMSKIKKAN